MHAQQRSYFIQAEFFLSWASKKKYFEGRMPHKTEKKTKQLLRWLLTFIKNQDSEKNWLDFVKVVHITRISTSPSCASNFSSRSSQILAVFSSVKMVSQYPSSDDAQLHRTYTSRDSLYRSLFSFHICCACSNNQFLSLGWFFLINISRSTIQYAINRVCIPLPIYISRTHFITY